jgi:hypothetical protein
MLEICKSLLIQAVAIVRKWFLVGIILGLVMVMGAIALHTYDAAISDWCTGVCHGTTRQVANGLSVWGNYRTGSLILCATILIAGLVCRRKTWQTAAIACLFGVTLAGLEADVPKSLLGRARPNSGLQDGFYGPSLEYKYQSFPSGHDFLRHGRGVGCRVAARGRAGARRRCGRDVVAGVSWSALSDRRVGRRLDRGVERSRVRLGGATAPS